MHCLLLLVKLVPDRELLREDGRLLVEGLGDSPAFGVVPPDTFSFSMSLTSLPPL